MREAMTNQAIGRRYNEAFGRWMDRNPWSRKIDKGTRNHLLWIADNLPAVEAWRETLAANQRDAWNHPTSIKRHYEQAIRVAEIKRAGGEPAPSPMAQLKQSLAESREQVAIWQKRARDGGSLFDLREDTAKNIAELIVRECSTSRVETLIRELKAAQKRRSLHAG